jgi:S1-C subfamily serine protease
MSDLYEPDESASKGNEGLAGTAGSVPAAGPGAPPEAPAWGHGVYGWPPPPGPGSHPGMPGALGSEAAAPGTPPPARRGGRRLAAVMAALLLIVAAGAGVGIGHLVWSPAVSAAAPGSTTSPSGSGSAGGSGSPYSGESPFGSGGELPSGSGGSVNPYYGELPSGSGGSSTGAEGAGAPSDVAAIAAKVDPALVDVNSTFSYQSAQGAGTGIVLTSNGEVLTNNHVIDGATKISVTDVGNGKTYAATVVGYDPVHDIAVLQLQDASGLQTAKLANSSQAATGESVVAIGNAGGTGGTPTSAGGSITALNQSITASDELDGTSEQLAGLIETNADVQPGDSGGSLVNAAGQVIGMDTAASDGVSFGTPSSQSQSYAIPINEALATAEQIEAGDGSSDVHVGASALLGVLVSSSVEEGVSGAAVSGVVSGDAAADAGIAAGDVITSLGGQSVASSAALSREMITYHPGNQVQIGWTDSSGQSHTATVTLDSGPPA